MFQLPLSLALRSSRYRESIGNSHRSRYMPSSPLSLSNRLRNVSFLLVLIAVVCVAAPFYVRRTAASRFGDRTPSLLPSSQTTIARNYGELALSFERNDSQTSAE